MMYTVHGSLLFFQVHFVHMVLLHLVMIFSSVITPIQLNTAAIWSKRLGVQRQQWCCDIPCGYHLTYHRGMTHCIAACRPHLDLALG